MQSSFSGEVGPLIGQLVKDLPEPPRLKATIDDYVRQVPRVPRRVVEEEFKLRYHFGGYHVLTVRTADGLAVIAAGRAGTGELRAALDSLRPEQRRNSVSQTVEPWEEADFVPEENGSGTET
jgi:hypothetical protein